MITFISEYPDAANEKDGMMQRVLHVDRLCAETRRQYLSISLFGNILFNSRFVASNVRVVKLNFFVHFYYLAFWMARSRVVYCHSIYNSLRILPFFIRRDVIVDMHGSVPEELSMMGRFFRAWLYQLVEYIVLWRSGTLVCVTRSMVRHFSHKYSNAAGKSLVLPILSESAIAALNVRASSEIKENIVVYSGGAQAWQNIGLMLQCASENSGFHYCFLTPDVAAFQSRISVFKTFPRCSVQGVRPDEVSKYYAAAKYGFLLRDDVVVNRVACPTKCVEYISNGVIPVLKSKDIGDFLEFGLKGVDWQDFSVGRLPDPEEQASMVERNYMVLDKMRMEVASGSLVLKALLQVP